MFDLTGPDYVCTNRYDCHVCGIQTDRLTYWLDGKFRFCEKCRDRYYRSMEIAQMEVRESFRRKIFSRASGDCFHVTDQEGVVKDAQFLLDRLADFEPDNISDQNARDWSGHVVPAIERLNLSLGVTK